MTQDNAPMSDFESEFLEKENVYETLGKYVLSTILNKLEKEEIHLQLSSFRVKTLNSVVEKISRKNYKKPWEDITDFVGVRFVALLSKDIQIVSSIVEKMNGFKYSKDRDYEKEKEKNPELFGYQSNHYVVRTEKEIEHEGIVIPSGTCCEIQVRGLLQHAYAEVTHDSIYKSDWQHSPKVPRLVSNSMALMEAADFLLCQTMGLIKKDTDERIGYIDELTSIYKDKVGSENLQFNPKYNQFILQHFNKEIDQNSESLSKDISELFSNKSKIINKINKRKSSGTSDILWKQPVVLLVYWLVEKYERKIIDEWPYGSSRCELESVYVDLGKPFESR